MNSIRRSRKPVPLSLALLSLLWGLIAFVLSFPYLGGQQISHTVMDGGGSGAEITLAPHPGLWMGSCVGTALCAGLAPLLALRKPRLAGILSLAPLVPLAVESPGINLSLACVPSLIGVASVALHRSRRLGWLLGGAAFVIPFLFAFVDHSALWVIGNVIVSSSGANFGKQFIMFLLYGVGIVLALGTATALSLLKGRREERRRVEAQSAEVDARAALARDLHDVVAHRMSLVAVRAETAPFSLNGISSETRAAFADIAAEARGALDEMRTVLGVLDRGQGLEPQLAPQPGSGDIPHLIATAQQAGASIELIDEVPELDSLTGTTAYRVVQEALTNARRHEPNETATVHLKRNNDVVAVNVSNPTGADHFDVGRGLAGMRERVERSGGEFRVSVEQGQFTVEALLPLGKLTR